MRDNAGDGAGPVSEQNRARSFIETARNQKPLESSVAGKARGRVKLLEPYEELSLQTVKARDRNQNIRLKKMLARFAIAAVSFQLAAAFVVLVYYLCVTSPEPSEMVIVAWLSATVVEVIGIVYIIARNLFPDRARRKSNEEKRAPALSMHM